MKANKRSEHTVIVETYITTRADWPLETSRMVNFRFNYRGLRLINGSLEWRYFETIQEANEWCDKAHINQAKSIQAD